MSVTRGMRTLTAMRLVKAVGGLATHALLCRFFGSEGYGVLALGFAALGLVKVVDLNTSDALQTLLPLYVAEGQGGRARRVLWWAYALNSCLAVVGSLVLVAFGSDIAAWFGDPRLEAVVVGLALWNLLPVLRGPLDPDAMLGLRRYRSLFWFRTLEVTGSVGAVLATGWTGGSPGAYLRWLLAFSLPTVVLSLVLSLPLVKELRGGDPGGRPLARLLRLAGPLSLGQSLYRVYANVGTPLVGGLLSVSAAGVYRFALTIAEMTTEFLSSIAQVYHPLLAEARTRGRESLARLYREAVEVTITLAVPALWGLVVWAEPVALLLGRGEFAGSVPLLQVLAFQVLFRVAAQPAYRTLLVLERSITATVINAVKVAGEIGLAILLVGWLGMTGMVIAHAAAALIAATLLYMLARRALGAGAGGVAPCLGIAMIFLAGYALLSRGDVLLTGNVWVDRTLFTCGLLAHAVLLITRSGLSDPARERIRGEMLRFVPFVSLLRATAGAPLTMIRSAGIALIDPRAYGEFLASVNAEGLSSVRANPADGLLPLYRKLRRESGMVHLSVVEGEWRALVSLLIARASGRRPVLVTVFSGVVEPGAPNAWHRWVRTLADRVQAGSGATSPGEALVAEVRALDPEGWGSGIRPEGEGHASCAP